jgi:RNA polymerase subunit RPABC4/transcription elongation factor Spt4
MKKEKHTKIMKKEKPCPNCDDMVLELDEQCAECGREA